MSSKERLFTQKVLAKNPELSDLLAQNTPFDRIHEQLNQFIHQTMKELIQSKQNVKKAFMHKRHQFYTSSVGQGKFSSYLPIFLLVNKSEL